MIHGLGSDVCPVHRWEHLVARYGPERCAHKFLPEEEAAYVLESPPRRQAERLAGRWALREAFGKALGTGLDGWSWKELHYRDGRLAARGSLAGLLTDRGISRIHGSVSHDGGIAFAVVILEG